MEAEKITQGIENMWRGQNTVSSTATNFRSQITSVLSLNQFFLSCVTSQSLEYVNIHNNESKKVLKNTSQIYKTLRTL